MRLATVLSGAMLILAACGGDPGTGAEPEPIETPTVDALPGRLMFSRFDESTHTFQSTHTSDTVNSDEVELPLPGPEGGGRWSHDAKHIAVMTITDDNRVGTAIITPDGTVERLLELPDPTLNLVCVAWSPDDSRLACEGWDESQPSRAGIYSVQSRDGGGLLRLTETPEGLGDRPGDYSVDGTELLFWRGEGEEAGTLYVVPSSGGKARQLSDQQVDQPGRFSPDGASILTSNNGALLILDTDGTVIDEITAPGHQLFGAVWSPDGSHIAYSKGAAGPFADVYISRSDGSEEQQVTDTPDNEIVVEWGAG